MSLKVPLILAGYSTSLVLRPENFFGPTDVWKTFLVEVLVLNIIACDALGHMVA